MLYTWKDLCKEIVTALDLNDGRASDPMMVIWNEKMAELENPDQVKEMPLYDADRHDDIEEMCPNCGGKMIKRTNHGSGQAFMGCSNFPKCKVTRALTNTATFKAGEHVEDW